MEISPFPSAKVGAIAFQATNIRDAVRWLIARSERSETGVNVRLANAYNVALADKDPSYRALFESDNVNFPDGRPVVWAMNSHSLSTARAGQVRGPSLMLDVLRATENRGTRHFFLGSTEVTLRLLVQRIKREMPHAIIAGSFSPPFAPIDSEYIESCVVAINEADPDIVWIGLGTPKQDFLGTRLAERLPKVFVNVGAAFDYTAGTVREAPRWIQGTGIEWLFRLATEPARLWRRYLFGNSRFLFIVLKSALSGRHS